MVGIASHQTHNNGFLFAALKSIYGAEFNAGICFFEGSRK